ncbi:MULTISPECIES: hypothetical protein [unclassified Bradyrhizobium]|uniref:hypothetical protein n=1 Tax=unclassified Bradyrhizobium TaxID=2631580 RepID=UPI003393F496
MTSFKFLGAALVFSATLATPASAWEPAAALAADPTFSIYSGMHGDIYSGMQGDASDLYTRWSYHRYACSAAACGHRGSTLPTSPQ